VLAVYYYPRYTDEREKKHMSTRLDAAKSEARSQVVKKNALDREKEIVWHIVTHPGCSQRSIFRAVKGDMQYPTMRNHLKRLVEKRRITQERTPGSQSFRYYADIHNPFVTIMLEVHEFEPVFLHLVHKSVDRINSHYSKADEDIDYVFEVVIGLFLILHAFINTYLFRATIRWHDEVDNPETRKELNVLVVEAISRIQHTFYLELRRSKFPNKTLGWFFSSMWEQTSHRERYGEILAYFAKKRMDKDVRAVLDRLPVELFGKPNVTKYPTFRYRKHQPHRLKLIEQQEGPIKKGEKDKLLRKLIPHATTAELDALF
jgi:hypothetical protein